MLWTFALPQPTFAELHTPSPGPIKNAGGLDLVLFALLFTLVPPAVMLLVEIVAERIGPRVLKAVHLLFVTGLAAIIASPIVFRTLEPSSKAQTLLALVIGALFALVYAKLALVRSLTTALVFAPVAFVLLFLFTAPVSNFVLGKEKDFKTYPTAARAPVVFIVFDEFNSNALMDANGKLDTTRYPNFARLARQSTWFRNAMADHSFTDIAVPTILTANSAPQHSSPHVWQFPSNLFGALGGYKVHAVEQVTDLCPEKLCPERGSFPQRLPGLYRDITLLGLKSVMPDFVTYHLPQLQLYKLTPGDEFSRFYNGLQPTRGRTLNFGHMGYPHMLHDRLPTGKTYPLLGEAAGRSGGPGGVLHWDDDPWLVKQGYQRYLLHVGYTDRLLGKIIDRMKKDGFWDRAAVIVVADHGVAHNPGDERRAGTKTNLAQIMPVPMFVKAPNQRRAKLVSRHVQTVDFLPTLFAALRTKVPYKTDGRSGFDPTLDRKTLTMTNLGGPKLTISATQLDRQRAALLRRQTRLFGQEGGTDPDSIYELGLERGLWGRSVTTAAPGGGLRAQILAPTSFSWNPGHAVEPARLYGQLNGPGAKPGMRLVVAMNGRIRTETQTFALNGHVRFASMLPPSKLRTGRNEIEVLGLSGSAAHPRLALLARHS